MMRRMGLAALYPKRRTRAPGDGHPVYPFHGQGFYVPGGRYGLVFALGAGVAELQDLGEWVL